MPAGGYAEVRRRWRDGTQVVLLLDVSPRLTVPNPRIDAVRGCLAIERGPVVYCLELPGLASPNPWVQAFVWVRTNTPVSAYFALDPKFMLAPDEDQHGFRALAERSRMADRVKDSGACSMFPQLSETWRTQVRALDGWQSFKPPDFERLHHEFGVTWVVLQTKTLPDLPCPYGNSSVLVCRLDQGVASK